jgi:hypothetical protein
VVSSQVQYGGEGWYFQQGQSAGQFQRSRGINAASQTRCSEVSEIEIWLGARWWTGDGGWGRDRRRVGKSEMNKRERREECE